MGNPHSSGSGPGQASDSAVCSARRRVLEWFNAPAGEYVVVFTSGATAALKLVGEAFEWNPDSTFRVVREAHTSLVGIREQASAAGATNETVSTAEAIKGGHAAASGATAAPSLLGFAGV